MDESGEQNQNWSIRSLSDVTAKPGTSQWIAQMAALDRYHDWLKATKAPKIHGHVDLDQADREARGRKVRAGKASSTNPNNPKNKSTPLSTVGKYGEPREALKALDDWPR